MLISEKSLRAVRLVVFALLFVSALTVFLLGDNIWMAIEVGSLPLWAGFVAPIVFTVFVFFFLLDRVFQVRQGRYPLIRAFVQVVLAVVFLSIIWPQQTKAFQTHQHLDLSTQGVTDLFKSRDPRIRALACEVLSMRKDVRIEVLREQAKHDLSDTVRKICTESLKRVR
ncbi:MAG: HEAT repeat domain-containing protein [Myxococcota bacterium]|jgi:hypothetical protein|nr:HEAT repeat domain-containing protein [Myxococcota bacterium]